jgi:general stress protein 26
MTVAGLADSHGGLGFYRDLARSKGPKGFLERVAETDRDHKLRDHSNREVIGAMNIQADHDAAIRKLADLIGEIRIATLTTTTADGSLRSRPMTTQGAKFDGQLWFFSKRDSHKAEEVLRQPHVSLSYTGIEGNCYVWVSGRAKLVCDPKKAAELWDGRYDQWFPDGPRDPSLVLIQVTVEQAEYWHASAVSPLETGFVVLAPQRRDDPEFHSKIALLSEYGPVVATNAPCGSCGMFHPTVYHRAFPYSCGTGETPRDAGEDLIRRLAKERDTPAEAWPRETVDRAIAEVRMWLETQV